MKKKFYGLIVMWMLLCSVNTAGAQVSIGIGLPNVSIGINLPLFPELTPVPGYPVYYAPEVNANYFFYDGMYWVYQNDNWYASTWYNGPWAFVEPEVVPLFILRIPVRYYRQPPVYFRGWYRDAPPRWDRHWGHEWERNRRGWDKWNRGSAPARAPRPDYQRRYSGERYPRAAEQQYILHRERYRYEPRDRVVRQHFQRVRQEGPPARRAQDPQRQRPVQRSIQPGIQPAPRPQPQHRGDDNIQRSAPVIVAPQQRAPEIRDRRQRPGEVQREQQAPRLRDQKERSPDREHSQDEPRRGGHVKDQDKGQDKGQDKDDERGRGRNN